MDINKETIFFRSVPEYYFKEKNGKKPNTVRHIVGRDAEIFGEYKETLKYIVISDTDTGEWFERELTDISSVTLFDEANVWIFSWSA
ncbi:hypothetical protein KAW18_11580 [candidate division WOR-3 bacterium]|nr:hypothetical protein [candidate division WOR-3 bacterium]